MQHYSILIGNEELFLLPKCKCIFFHYMLMHKILEFYPSYNTHMSKIESFHAEGNVKRCSPETGHAVSSIIIIIEQLS